MSNHRMYDCLIIAFKGKLGEQNKESKQQKKYEVFDYIICLCIAWFNYFLFCLLVGELSS